MGLENVPASNNTPDNQELSLSEERSNKERQQYGKYIEFVADKMGIPKEDYIKVMAYAEDEMRANLEDLGKNNADYFLDRFFGKLINVEVKEVEGNGWEKLVRNGDDLVGVTSDGTKVVFNGSTLILKYSDGRSEIRPTNISADEIEKKFGKGTEYVISELDAKKGIESRIYTENQFALVAEIFNDSLEKGIKRFQEEQAK